MIGLIFGDTSFPSEILKKIKKRRLKYLLIDLSKSKKFKKDKNSYSVSVGQFGKIINILKQNNCKKVLFAGKVAKPKFSVPINTWVFSNSKYKPLRLVLLKIKAKIAAINKINPLAASNLKNHLNGAVI